ncbi:unnamed protein product [Lampetra fluviatilis]
MRFGFKSPALVSRCVRQPWPDRDAAAAGASAQEARGGAGKPRSRQRRSDRSARRKGADRAAGGEEEEGGRAYWTDAERPRDTPFADETKDTKGPAGHASPPRRSRHGSCIAGALRTLQVRVIKTRALEQSAGATSQLLRAPRLHAHYATRDGDATGWEAARQQPLVAGPPLLLLLEPHRARPQGTATGHGHRARRRPLAAAVLSWLCVYHHLGDLAPRLLTPADQINWKLSTTSRTCH